MSRKHRESPTTDVRSGPHSPGRRRLLGTLVALPWLAPAGPALAQVGREYRIELVIFQHLTEEGRRLLETTEAALQPSPGSGPIGEGTYRHSRRGFDLGHVVRRIEDDRDSRLIATLAWDQRGRDHASTPWLTVREGRPLDRRTPLYDDRGPASPILQEPAEERHELEGRLRVWVGRFLHLETDLIFHDATAGNGAIAVRGHQRMNSGDDLFYLDHPVVGMIARVTRIDTSD
ncbi:CsiV family protein [Thioalkalivibrio sp. ALE11]|uniref:CsiV family protein n=1 Tax=Thioalkalivibrio sp. ALE11 TaxID=1265494 RepID=UPI0003638F4F|nr:CsiV family protein [Thioalkalivibrio sp. ALE11]